MPRRLLLTVFGLLIIAAVAWFFLMPKLNKPKETAKIRTASNLFVYEDVIGKKEPSFSLKLPNGWYRDLGVKGNERLLSFSPDRDNKGITYRAFISATVVPTKLDLAGEVARARKDIGLLAVDQKFTTDKSITVNEWAWPEFVGPIEKSINTISFN